MQIDYEFGLLVSYSYYALLYVESTAIRNDAENVARTFL